MLALAALVLIDLPLIVRDPILNTDDHLILDPLLHAPSLAGYWHSRADGQIHEVDPVRDLSLLGDIWLRKVFPGYSFHFTALLLWLLTVAAFGLVIRLYFRKRAPLAAALFMLHPALAPAYAWFSARKHVLAALFALLATARFLRLTDPERSTLRNGWVAGLSVTGIYFLSVFSHPIALLLPLWFCLLLWSEPGRRGRGGLRVIFSSLPVMMIGAYLNYRYYSPAGLHFMQTGMQKIGRMDPGISLLALGRYFLNAVIPIRIGFRYFPNEFCNWLGLALFFPAMLALVFVAGRRQAALCAGFFFFSLMVVTFRLTNIFVMDIYLILPLVGVALAGIAMGATKPIQSWIRGHSVLAMAAFFAAFGFFAMTSAGVARSFQSDRLLWARAARISPALDNQATWIAEIVEEGDGAGALRLLPRLRTPEGTQADYPFLFAKAVYISTGMSLEEKTRLIESSAPQSAWSHYFLALLQANRRDFAAASSEMDHFLANPAESLTESVEEMAAQARFFCEQTARNDCGNIQSRFQSLKRPPEPWQASRFDEGLNSLRHQWLQSKDQRK